MTADLIVLKKISKPSYITSFLWVLAKYKFVARDNNYIDFAMEQLIQDPNLEVNLACRNLWNLSSLQHKHDIAIEHFIQVILNNKDKINEIDASNALTSFNQF